MEGEIRMGDRFQFVAGGVIWEVIRIAGQVIELRAGAVRGLLETRDSLLRQPGNRIA